MKTLRVLVLVSLSIFFTVESYSQKRLYFWFMNNQNKVQYIDTDVITKIDGGVTYEYYITKVPVIPVDTTYWYKSFGTYQIGTVTCWTNQFSNYNFTQHSLDATSCWILSYTSFTDINEAKMCIEVEVYTDYVKFNLNEYGVETSVFDTITVNDTIQVNDTVVTHVYDTTFTTIYDTLVTDIYDTTIVTVQDTNSVHDTTFTTIYDTTLVTVQDTNSVYDTISVQVYDTINIPVYDTLVTIVQDTNIVNVQVYDTTHIEDHIIVYDTLIVNKTVYDTLYTTVTDTTMVNDTVKVEKLETITRTIYDTTLVTVQDTLTFTVPEIVDAIQGMTEIVEIKVYPNPTSDYINVLCGEYSQGLKNMKIYNGSGKLMINKFLNSGLNTFDVNGFTPGHYIMQVIESDKVLSTKHLIVK